MPELPEVQTIVDDLNKKIKGDKIVDFWSDWKKSIKDISFERFRKEVFGRKILKVCRLGKGIYIDLEGGKTIHIHLKMTGHLLVKSGKLKVEKSKKSYFDEKVNQYIHHIWKLRDENEKFKSKKEYSKTLEFSDLRKFGKIVLLDTDKISEFSEVKKMGIDAMSKEFTLNKFKEILNKKKNKKIGLLLMEQEQIAGIGNIYRSEILFDAGIHPERKASDLSEEEMEKIYDSIKKILKKAIKLRGTSESDYRDTDGAPGNFHKVLKVYRKEGKKCSRVQNGKKCDTLITRIKLGQRSAFFCPKCQK